MQSELFIFGKKSFSDLTQSRTFTQIMGNGQDAALLNTFHVVELYLHSALSTEVSGHKKDADSY